MNSKYEEKPIWKVRKVNKTREGNLRMLKNIQTWKLKEVGGGKMRHGYLKMFKKK